MTAFKTATGPVPLAVLFWPFGSMDSAHPVRQMVPRSVGPSVCRCVGVSVCRCVDTNATIEPMNTFSNAFRAEVARMARKEIKPELQGMRKAITSHRSEIAALKREVKALTSQLKSSRRQIKVADEPKAKAAIEETGSKKPRQIQFNAQTLVEKRAALGITQKEMALLLGASSLSVYKWESGRVHPRAAQLERIAQVLKLGKRKALALLSPQ